MILEIVTPGTTLNYDDRDFVWNTSLEIENLKSYFYEANTALYLSMTSDTAPRSFEERRAKHEWKMQRSCEVERKLINKGRENLTHEEISKIYIESERLVNGELIKSGHIPQVFRTKMVFIFNKAFIYAVDNFERHLEIFSKQKGVPVELRNQHAKLKDLFPNLRKIRNSAHHPEDRRRKIGPGGKSIKLQPINNGIFNAPGGNVLVTGILNGNRYGETTEDGHYNEIEVSLNSLKNLQGVLQAIIESFEWIGSPSYEPCV